MNPFMLPLTVAIDQAFSLTITLMLITGFVTMASQPSPLASDVERRLDQAK